MAMPQEVLAHTSEFGLDSGQIQIQIQIGSLHTRLDEIDEMTNTGGIPAGPFLGARTTRAPRDAGGPPFVLSARTKPRIKGGELQ